MLKIDKLIIVVLASSLVVCSVLALYVNQEAQQLRRENELLQSEVDLLQSIIRGKAAVNVSYEVIEREPGIIELPEPILAGNMSTEEAISRRRSRRDYSEKPLNIVQLSQVLWSAQGITNPRGFRAAPSAGATYPLELHVVIGDNGVAGLSTGVYHYNPSDHTINRRLEGDLKGELAVAALDQRWVAEARVNIVMTAVYERTTTRYGERGIRYVHMEAGHSAQNIYLECESLGLATVVIGAFYDQDVGNILQLPTNEVPLYVIPVAYPEE